MSDDKPESLGEAFPKEQARIRQLIADYRDLPGGAGHLGAMFLEDTLRRADEAAISGDVVAMIGLYEEMRSCN